MAQSATWPAAFGYEDEAVHRIRIGPFGFPHVAVGILGDTVWLPFDTGNMVGLTLESALFNALGLSCSEQWRRVTADGEPISTGCVATKVETQLFGQSNDSLPVFEFFDERLPGLVGPGSLPGRRFTLDYERQILAVDGNRGPGAVEGFVAVPMSRSLRHPRLILVPGLIGGREVLIEIDTGKSRTTVDRRLVEELGLEEEPHGVDVGEVQLGPRRFLIRSARLTDTSGISRGLPMRISLGLGSDLLSGFVFTVDYSSDQFWMER